MTDATAQVLPVLLTVRPPAPAPWGPVPGLPRSLFSPGTAALVATAFLLGCLGAEAQSAAAGRPGALAILAKWFPLIMSGFLVNLGVSILSMAIGTAAGVLLGLGQISLLPAVRRVSWVATQFFRNAPWLVLLFYAMLLLPFEMRVLGVTVPLPAWIKAVIGLALPVMANVAEIVRGGIQSIPQAQWESAEALAFDRRQTLWMIIIPQAVKRMIPPWMNLYAILTMATTLVSVVGLQDGLTLTRAAVVAEGRSELLIPLYLMLLALFFAYCYPIARWTQSLERRFAVKG